MDLSKDDHLRINLSPKKIRKGYNGYVSLFIQMIYDTATTPPEIIQIIDSNSVWKTFLEEYYNPYLEKLSFELGGYHPRTKKETNGKTTSEPEDGLFQGIRNFEEGPCQGTSHNSFKINGWMNTGNGGVMRNGFMEEIGSEYDDYYDNSLNLVAKKKEEKDEGALLLQDLNEKEKNLMSPKIEEKNLMEEEERMRNGDVVEDFTGANGVMKCRYDYEEDYFFD